MKIASLPMPAVKRHIPVNPNREGSKYDFDSLRADTDDCIVVDGLDTLQAAEKAATRLSSAAAQHRKRVQKAGGTMDYTIAVRKGSLEDGSFYAGAWKVSLKDKGAADVAPAEGADQA